MKKMFVLFSFLAFSLGASATNSAPTIDEACTVCLSTTTGGAQCAASPDGCYAAGQILLMFLV